VHVESLPNRIGCQHCEFPRTGTGDEILRPDHAPRPDEEATKESRKTKSCQAGAEDKDKVDSEIP
jgi:hypothetical protein